MKKAALLFLVFSLCSLQGADRPNVVLILADDLGWMDLASYAACVRGVNRSECYYETPNLDRLADQGLSFSQAYACPLCSPARASILTGQYAVRHGFLTASGHTKGSYYSRKMTPKKGYHIHDRKENEPEKANPALGYITPSFTYALQSGQPDDERDAVTIAEALKGYRSAMLGKWHLGALGVKGYQPKDQGFEELAYFDHGGSPYFDWQEKWQEAGKPGADLGVKYLTDDLTERAVRFIRECNEAKQPFFLYFPHFAVHSPREAKPEDYAYFEKKPTRGWNGHSMPEYAGVLRGLDNSVGRIVKTLDQLGIAEDTLLIFMSDNGGIDRETATSNAPLRDGKGSKYEGGIRVPLILHWPGKVDAGAVCDVPVDCNDMFPTILSVAGQKADPDGMLLDGQSLVPLFRDPKNRAGRYTRNAFFWHAPFGGLDKKGNYKPAHSAVRKGDYKLLFDHQGYFELYNLADDISEKNNLADSMPEKTQEMFALLNGLMNKTVLPKYQPRANPLYDPDANARSAAPPYRNVRKLPVETVSKPVVKKPALGPNVVPSLIRTRAKGKPQQKDGSLAKMFVNPPDEYRSGVKWEWCNGMINEKGVTGDLEAMKRAGLGGGKIFNVGGIEGPVRFASPEWYEIVAFACREAGRLGLELGLNMTEGFCAAGGPWIKPEQSMQHVVWGETEVAGPGAVSITLAEPDDGPIEATVLKLKDVGYYKDIKVFAVPQVEPDRIKFLEIKKGLMPHRYDPKNSLVKTPENSVAAADIIPAAKVIDLTDNMDEKGNLKWDAPAGKWTILRMGTASTGACTRPGSEKTRGLEADKLSREAVKFHFDSLCKPLLEMDGVKPGETLKFFAIDSWEADGQNWSPVLAAEFEKRRGYSLYPYLPVLTGRIVESSDVSERFLWDFRRTIADCIRDNFYGYVQDLAQEHGMVLDSEPFSRAAYDGMETTEAVGVPTATFWHGAGSWGRAHNEGKFTSSAAHLTGKKKVSSEAFPAGKTESGWVHYPWTYKWLADYAYASGINHLSFHCFAFQPWDDKVVHKPGMTFRHWGVQYSRFNTWWNQSTDWQAYQTRCQFMLQQGKFHAEALFMTPEAVPGLELKCRYSLPLGYDWDMTSAKMVREELLVKDGRVCAPSGMKYHILVLPKIDEISVPLLKKLETLVADGAHVVVSSRPKTSRGLVNYPASKKEVADIVSEMWQKLDGKKVKEQSFGKGKLYWERPEDVLKKLGVEPDVIVQAEGENRGKLPINYLHRYTPEADFYFVSSSSDKPSSGLLSFRVTARQPEFWYPDTGRIEPCTVYEEEEGRTIVPMIFDPAGSMFVAFRNKAATPSVTQVLLDGKPALSTAERINPHAVSKDFFKSGGGCTLRMSDNKKIEAKIAAQDMRSLSTNWDVTFSGVAAPPAIKFKKLIPWNEHSDDAIRYFSGTGIYRKTIDIAKNDGQRVWLDLGSVEVIATVVVNGKEQGILWKPPFLIDITDAVESGKNELEIRITNLWANRLIRDEQFPSDLGMDKPDQLRSLPDWFVNNAPRPEQRRKTFTTYKHYMGTEPLFPSGLVGPVSLITRLENANPIVEQITRDLFLYSRNPESLSYGRHREAPFKKEKEPKKPR